MGAGSLEQPPDMPRGPVLPAPTPTTAAPTRDGRRPAVAAETSVRLSPDSLPRSSVDVDHRRLGNYANRVSPAGQTARCRGSSTDGSARGRVTSALSLLDCSSAEAGSI